MSDPAAETESGIEISITFEARRCIHARHCVLEAPSVFRANTPGRWIAPDAMPADLVAAVIRNCPSGALSYTSSAVTEEEAPPVNMLRIRENGPYALRAAIRLPDGKPAVRRTLCRCGHSADKPYCDGRHAEIGFAATGEPQGRGGLALPERGGELAVEPLPDGPLRLVGPLEIITGTGKTIDRVEDVCLCRCGHSATKPYCDGTHQRIGFTDQSGGSAAAEAAPAAVKEKEEVPTLAAWAGGREKLLELTERFYRKVPDDPVLAPVFAAMDPAHFRHVADFVAEVLGGGTPYTGQGGSHNQMVSRHLGRHLTEEQRRRWIDLMLDTADEVGLPSDPEFRAAFLGYLEWGTRLAVANSQEGVSAPTSHVPMPKWGWGPPGGPYRG